MTTPADLGKRTADEVRDARLRLRSWLWDHSAPSAGLRVVSCGRKQVAGFVEVRAAEGSSGLGGVSTCGSVWVCPMCSAKVASTRSAEVQDAIRAWQAQSPGGAVLLATFTLQHHKGHALADTWDALGRGWASVRNGKPWKADAAHFGIAGYVRVVEVTRSERNGWHPHMHVLLFVDKTPDAETVERLRGRLYGRWSRRLAKEGYKTLSKVKDKASGKLVDVGVDVRVANAHDVAYLAEYLSKFGYVPKGGTGTAGSDGHTSWDLAREITRGDLKRGRKGSRTPWEILESAAAGSAADAALWAEWEKASKGRRQYAWAAGFRESLDLSRLATDEQVADEADKRLDVVALLRRDQWRALVADLRARRDLPGAPLMSLMLNAAANLDPDTFRGWLTSRGIEHVHPEHEAAAGPATPEAPEPVALPGREHVSANRAMQAHREAHARPVGHRPPAQYACRVCALELAPAQREGQAWEWVDERTGEIHSGIGTGVHVGCTPEGYRADRLASGS